MPAKATFGQRGAAPRSSPERRAPAAVASAPSPRLQAASEDAPRARHDHDFFVPFATVALVLALCLIFVLEIHYAIDLDAAFSPSLQALVVLGGIDGHLVFGAAEWWRVFTAPMLHLGLFHLVSNCAVLALIGWYLEPLIGSKWFLAIFAVSALGGSAGSLAQNDPQLISVGASGAISGLLATAIITGSRIDDPQRRRRMQAIAVRILMSATVPAFFSASANHGHVDYGAHLGGAMAGAAVALLLSATWNKITRRPGLLPLAAGIGCAFAIAVVAAFAMTMVRAPVYAAQRPQFIPQSQVPDDVHQDIKKASDWIEQYPTDPRGYFYKGLGLLYHNDSPGAAEELRHALSLYSASQDSFTPGFGHTVRLALALTIKAEGDRDAARDMAKEACGASEAPQSLLELTRKQGICP
jgi:rhomboid protease GluP